LEKRIKGNRFLVQAFRINGDYGTSIIRLSIKRNIEEEEKEKMKKQLEHGGIKRTINRICKENGLKCRDVINFVYEKY